MDKNSNHFHATTVQRRDKNRIQQIKNETADWVEGQEEVSKVVVKHF